jgi:hypothetical protein
MKIMDTRRLDGVRTDRSSGLATPAPIPIRNGPPSRGLMALTAMLNAESSRPRMKMKNVSSAFETRD